MLCPCLLFMHMQFRSLDGSISWHALLIAGMSMNAEGCLLSATLSRKPCLSLCRPVHLGLTCPVALPHAATVWPNPSDADMHSRSQSSDVLDAAPTDATSDTNEYELDDDELLALAATQVDGS